MRFDLKKFWKMVIYSNVFKVLVKTPKWGQGGVEKFNLQAPLEGVFTSNSNL